MTHASSLPLASPMRGGPTCAQRERGGGVGATLLMLALTPPPGSAFGRSPLPPQGREGALPRPSVGMTLWPGEARRSGRRAPPKPRASRPKRDADGSAHPWPDRFSGNPRVHHGARPAARLIERIGEGPYKGLYSLVTLAGLVLIVVGYGQYRAHGWIDVWQPPVWTRHLALVARLGRLRDGRGGVFPGPHQGRAEAPDAGRREGLGARRISSPTATSARSCCSAASWPGRSRRASASSAATWCATMPARRRRPPGGATTRWRSWSGPRPGSCSAIWLHPLLIGVAAWPGRARSDGSGASPTRPVAVIGEHPRSSGAAADDETPWPRATSFSARSTRSTAATDRADLDALQRRHLAALVLLIAAVGGWRYWQHVERARAEAAGSALRGRRPPRPRKKTDEAERRSKRSPRTRPAGYRLLARFRRAGRARPSENRTRARRPTTRWRPTPRERPVAGPRAPARRHAALRTATPRRSGPRSSASPRRQPLAAHRPRNARPLGPQGGRLRVRRALVRPDRRRPRRRRRACARGLKSTRRSWPPARSRPRNSRREAGMTPTVAIVGRPNVGKSTLFNRLVGKKLALVDDRPASPATAARARPGSATRLPRHRHRRPRGGATRARSPAACARRPRRRSREADVVLFLIDARAGVTPADQHFAELVRRAGKPVILVANKAEGGAGRPAPRGVRARPRRSGAALGRARRGPRPTSTSALAALHCVAATTTRTRTPRRGRRRATRKPLRDRHRRPAQRRQVDADQPPARRGAPADRPRGRHHPRLHLRRLGMARPPDQAVRHRRHAPQARASRTSSRSSSVADAPARRALRRGRGACCSTPRSRSRSRICTIADLVEQRGPRARHRPQQMGPGRRPAGPAEGAARGGDAAAAAGARRRRWCRVSGLAGEGLDKLMEAVLEAARGLEPARLDGAAQPLARARRSQRNPPPAVSGRRIKIRYMTQAKSAAAALRPVRQPARRPAEVLHALPRQRPARGLRPARHADPAVAPDGQEPVRQGQGLSRPSGAGHRAGRPPFGRAARARSTIAVSGRQGCGDALGHRVPSSAL